MQRKGRKMEGKIEKRKREREKSLYPGHQRVKYSEMTREKRDGEHCPGAKMVAPRGEASC